MEPQDLAAGEEFGRFFEIVRILRGPQGCPWDREQTPESLKGFLLEEAFECLDAIGRDDSEHVSEELGDVFLIAAMIAYVYEQQGAFSVARVFRDIGDKLVRRHPHVFGDADASDSGAVKRQWDEIKTHIEGKSGKHSLLDRVSRGFSPLEAAFRLQRKAAKVGFDWPDYRPVIGKIHEELGELQAELSVADKATPGGTAKNDDQRGADIEQEVGDLLFSVVNLSRKLGIDPTLALHQANDKFRRRFLFVEQGMRDSGREMTSAEVDAMEDLWRRSKQQRP
ncbi:MAG: nucleoside triphosphate pyrophosphohydrolase [Spirochaetaceae bacterium]|nr:MAG: nucleoside triphosphate pyrophosphohydrolase [Spirochaetaceae bacterium]